MNTVNLFISPSTATCDLVPPTSQAWRILDFGYPLLVMSYFLGTSFSRRPVALSVST